MPNITITINLDNAAFDTDQDGLNQEGSLLETSRILRMLSKRFASGSWPMDDPIRDVNGNIVGTVLIDLDGQ